MINWSMDKLRKFYGRQGESATMEFILNELEPEDIDPCELKDTLEKIQPGYKRIRELLERRWDDE